MTEQIVFLGHTHIQLKKQRGNILAVNPGSVGLARDGGKVCYAVLENREITLRRIPCKVGETIKRLRNSPVSKATKGGLNTALDLNRI